MQFGNHLGEIIWQNSLNLRTHFPSECFLLFFTRPWPSCNLSAVSFCVNSASKPCARVWLLSHFSQIVLPCAKSASAMWYSCVASVMPQHVRIEALGFVPSMWKAARGVPTALFEAWGPFRGAFAFCLPSALGAVALELFRWRWTIWLIFFIWVETTN